MTNTSNSVATSSACKRCVCQQPKPEQVDEKTHACGKCGGWFAVSLTSPGDLERFLGRFQP